MAKKSAAKPTPRTPRQPEKKFGPFAGGINVAIWLNTAETDDGPKTFRSITVAPRRYQDRTTGDWKDAGSYQPSDLPALIFALTKAQEYVFTVPLPGQETNENEGPKEDVPF